VVFVKHYRQKEEQGSKDSEACHTPYLAEEAPQNCNQEEEDCQGEDRSS